MQSFDSKARDPEMSSTKKGNDWYFGIKAHVAVDVDNGTVYSLEATTAKVHDRRVWDELLHGEEKSVCPDKSYVSAEREAAFSMKGKIWGVMRKATKRSKLYSIDEEINQIIAKVRAKVDHRFCVIKQQFVHMKTQYRG
jgi:transposase, IS5 family